ncbi:hypothetical protein AGMMS50276_18880 [Synergistales bacterium]|nr:hypothetical protein AGMMS50276_18880 [Synergistales bacterium]
MLYLAIISFFCLFAVIGAMWIAIVLMLFFGVVIKIIQSDDSSVRFKEDISIHFLLGTRKTFGIFQGVGGVVFVYLYVYANTWIKIPLALQLMLWGVFLWHLTMTAIFYYAILECHKDIVFSEVDLSD